MLYMKKLDQMHKWLAPSSIHFLKMHREVIVESDENLVIELSNKLAHEVPMKVPKMQVTEKDGAMFALNNTSLQLMRQLEKQGKLRQIEVEIVPLSKVPFNIQQGMIADQDNGLDHGLNDGEVAEDAIDDDNDDDSKPETSKTGKKKGYHKLQLEPVKSNPKTSTTHQYPMATNSASSASETDHELEDEDDGEDDDSTESSSSSEALSCNVCDRSFSTARQLAQHQLQKRHFGCSVCDTVFPSLMALEQHKETLEHWSDDEHDNEQTDDDNEELDVVRPQREELERLL